MTRTDPFRAMHQIRRLDAMRDAARKLQMRPQIGLDVFTRFRPWERGELIVERKRVWVCGLYDLYSARARTLISQVATSRLTPNPSPDTGARKSGILILIATLTSIPWLCWLIQVVS